MVLVATTAATRCGARAIAAISQAMVAAALNDIAGAGAATLRDLPQAGHEVSDCWHRISRLHPTLHEAHGAIGGAKGKGA